MHPRLNLEFLVPFVVPPLGGIECGMPWHSHTKTAFRLKAGRQTAAHAQTEPLYSCLRFAYPGLGIASLEKSREIVV